MAVSANAPAPYAPASAVMEIINRYRNKGLPTPITGETLGRAGISPSLTPRTLQALEVLDLIDEKGAATPILVGLQKAPEPEFKQRLAEWLNAAYADVLNYINPADADETAIRDAFRLYNPVGQQPRMVTLFQGLYAAAGIITDKRLPTSRPTTRAASVPKPRVANSGAPRGNAPNAARNQPPFSGAGEIPAPLAGLLTTLPVSSGAWTKEDRDKFVNLFGNVIDYCFKVVPADQIDRTTDDE